MDPQFDDDTTPLLNDDIQLDKNAKASEAVKHLDEKWYRTVAKRARWMDLIGDYAGNERFMVDGVFHLMDGWHTILTLISPCLQRRVVVPARSGGRTSGAWRRRRSVSPDSSLRATLICASIDPSFQILHAVHIMEKFLDDLIKRAAVFDIVFFAGKV